MTSEARIEANRRNALGSTGPRDTSLTRFNALKHGLTTKKLVVTSFEKRKEYESLLESLRQDFQPQTATEEILLEQMAASLWRRQRILRVEKAEIEEKLAYALYGFDEAEKYREERVPYVGFPATAQHRLNALRESTTQRMEFHVEKQLRPSADALLIRYDSTLERQFYRALVMLLKIQAARQGHVSS